MVSRLGGLQGNCLLLLFENEDLSAPGETERKYLFFLEERDAQSGPYKMPRPFLGGNADSGPSRIPETLTAFTRYLIPAK